MNKSILKQMLTYFSKVYNLGEKIKGVVDQRIKPQIETPTIAFIVLLGFVLQVPSFNKLEYWINKGKFKKLFPKKTRMPSADAIRFCLDKIDLSSLNSMHKSIIRTAIENKVFRNGTIDGHKVFAIDGVELFESTEKYCDDCLTRVDRQGIIHYFHRAVVCISVGSDPHIILGEEMLKPKKDGSDKEWTVRLNRNKKVVVTAWDEDNFEMTGLDGTVRFLRFIEKISHGDKVEVKEVWMITTNKYISTETLWKIIHSRWNIENNGFHQLKGEWHLKHCFLHSPTGVEAVLIFIQVAFNLMQLFFFRCIRNFRDKKLLQTNIVDDIRDEPNYDEFNIIQTNILI